MGCAATSTLFACIDGHHGEHGLPLFGQDLGPRVVGAIGGEDATHAIGLNVCQLTMPVRYRQINVMFCCPHAPEQVMSGIIVIRCNIRRERNRGRYQANRVWESEQGGSAYEVGPFAGKHPQRFWEEHIVASCQTNAPRWGIERGQAQVARRGPELVLFGEVEFAVYTVNTLWVEKQDCI